MRRVGGLGAKPTAKDGPTTELPKAHVLKTSAMRLANECVLLITCIN